ERVGDRRLRRRARADGAAAGGRGVAGCGAAVLVRIQAGPGEHLPHVRLGVVVRVDGSGDVAGGAVLSEEVGGRDDRVGRIPAVGLAVVVAIQSVASPGAGEELHRPTRPGHVLDALLPAGGIRVATLVALDLADPGKHLPGNIERQAGL